MNLEIIDKRHANLNTCGIDSKIQAFFGAMNQ
jgi:hypothetical protein